MLFTKEFLQDLAGNYADNVEKIEETILDHSRWSVTYEMVFKYNDKFYKTTYSRGATEYQDESPFEHEDDEIEVPEVFPVQKTITVYE